MNTRSTFAVVASALTLATAITGGAYAQSKRSSMDQTFVTKAAQGNIAEIKAGQLALSRAVDASTRTFAQQMITDHTKAHMQLKQVAQQRGYRVPSDTDMKHKQLVNRMSKLSGQQFDQMYMMSQVKDHQVAIKLYRTQATRGRDPQLKQFAATMLPKLQSHHSGSHTIAMKMDSAGSDRYAHRTGTAAKKNKMNNKMNGGSMHNHSDMQHNNMQNGTTQPNGNM